MGEGLIVRRGGSGKKEGQYVWKKHTLEPVEITNPTVTMNGTLRTGADVASSVVPDLSMVDTSFFNGFNVNETSYFSYSEEEGLKYTNSKGTFSATWDAEAWTITMPSYTSTGKFTNTVFTYTGTKTAYQKSEDYSYVTADKATAYPNGGVLEGFWYEPFKEGVKYGVLFEAVNAEGKPTEITYRYAQTIPSGSNIFTAYANKAVVEYCEKITFEANFEDTKQFSSGNIFYDFFGKLKLKTNLIPKHFVYMAKTASPVLATSKQKKAVWIAKTVEEIGTGSSQISSDNAFYGSTDVKVYCEHESEPSNWGAYWDCAGTSTSNQVTLSVTWGVSEKQFDKL